MKNLSNNNFLKVVINLLFLLLLAKLISVVLLWFLPAQTKEYHEANGRVVAYKNLNFNNMLSSPSRKKEKSVQKRVKKESASIHDMILHGLYGNSSFGYAIVATKSNPKKTEIISVGERYRGYTLEKIALNHVVFSRNNKEYILEFDKSKNKQTKAVVSHVRSYAEPLPEGNLAVSRSEIRYYEKNPSQIWKDIAIDEIRKGKKILGFKVKKVRKNSKIAALGLQRGDIILKANGVTLDSYNKAFKIYRDINKLESLSLVIKRGNEEKELIYEIH